MANLLPPQRFLLTSFEEVEGQLAAKKAVGNKPEFSIADCVG